MTNNLKLLYSLLDKSQRRRLVVLQGLILLMAMFEVAGVTAIVPFMTLVSDPQVLQGDGLFAALYQYSGLTDPYDFIVRAGMGVLALLALATSVNVITSWYLTRYAQEMGAELGIQLFQYYLRQPWLFHTTHDSATLTNNIANECYRVVSNVVTPLLNMNARLVMVTLMLIAIFVYNPWVAGSGALMFGTLYWLMYRTVRKQLIRNGQSVTNTNRGRLKLMAEAFGGIKEILLTGRQADFNRQFQTESRTLARKLSLNSALAQLPRYLVELTAYSAIILLVLTMLSRGSEQSAALLPGLALYALAGFKLLPAFQQIYAGIANIRANLPALDSIKRHLAQSKYTAHTNESSSGKLFPEHSIQLQNISFHYPGKLDAALDDITLDIKAKEITGFAGLSGAGKSTLIDVLLGLIPAQTGTIKVDGELISTHNMRVWQNSLGYVPQSIFLADASIRSNIAFGVPAEQIDHERIQQAVDLSHIQDILDKLPEGLDTLVGERGLRLSGGQRQRIGIARALYHDPEVIILDEATSSLDTLSEKRIMDTIHDLMGQKTIILIAHRLSTVKRCHMIHVIHDGQLHASGRFEQLTQNNALFRAMSQAH